MAKNRNILQLIRICQSLIDHTSNIFYSSSLSAFQKSPRNRGIGVARVNNQINQINERLNQIFYVTYSPSRPNSLRRQFKISSDFFLFFVFTRVSGACFHRILVIFQKFVYLTRSSMSCCNTPVNTEYWSEKITKCKTVLIAETQKRLVWPQKPQN